MTTPRLLLGVAALATASACTDRVSEVIRPAPGAPVFSACPVFPADNWWNQDISAAPVDARSADYIAGIGPAAPLRADFGADPSTGIPYTIVGPEQPKVAVSFLYADESDPGPYPIPADVAIEGGAGATGERHAILVARGACTLYELWQLEPAASGWRAGSGAIWSLRVNATRPLYWTSASAAGLPIFPGLVRYDEVSAGEIRHALRFSAPATQRAFVAPASHWASAATDPVLPPMGLRVRLKATVDIDTYPPAAQAILKALKRYGMFLSDNGRAWFISGAPDARFAPDDLATLGRLHGSDFEALETGQITR